MSAAPSVLAALCFAAKPTGRMDTPSKSGGAAMEYWEAVWGGMWTLMRSSRFFDVDDVGGNAVII